MKFKKAFKGILLLVLLGALAFGIYYCWFAFPIISGYSAKNACSCAFIQGRTKESINKEELGSFPLSLGSIEINYKDSSVTGSVFGMAKRKAIYRSGLGCTLVNDLSEEAMRAQKFIVPFAINRMDSFWNTDGTDSFLINKPKLDDAVSVAFQQQYNNKPVLTRALLVVHKNRIIAEKYALGYHQNLCSSDGLWLRALPAL